MRINEIWQCVNSTPDEVLKIMTEEAPFGADSGNYERITVENFEELWESQDRYAVDNEKIKQKVLELVQAGKPWYWFTVHC